MEVFIAKHSGFCEGVELAHQIALKEVANGVPVFMLGKLVHNSQVIKKLESLGVLTVKDLSQVPQGSSGILIISAHGVPPQIYETAKKLGLKIVDTTCAWVTKAQKIAKKLADEGRLVIIVGDRNHTEVIGIVGWAYDKAVVVETVEDLDRLNISCNQKVGILAQTTQSEEHFRRMVEKLKTISSDVKDLNTICSATHKRQSAAVELARTVDLMLVVGDKMSANTKRLFELCVQTGTETHQIQTASELNKEWIEAKERVGVTAGASTPEWVVAEVVEKLRD